MCEVAISLGYDYSTEITVDNSHCTSYTAQSALHLKESVFTTVTLATDLCFCEVTRMLAIVPLMTRVCNISSFHWVTAGLCYTG